MKQAICKPTHSLTHSLTHLFFALMILLVFTHCKEEPTEPIKENPCDCDRTNITDGWELQNTYQTSTTRTIPFN